MRWWVVLIIVIAIVAAAIAILYFLGKRAEKKQAEQQEQIEGAHEVVGEKPGRRAAEDLFTAVQPVAGAVEQILIKGVVTDILIPGVGADKGVHPERREMEQCRQQQKEQKGH